jgi:hypothetical protein
MRPSLALATLVTSAAAVLSAFVVPAGTASAITNAAATIDGLQAQGYQVNIDRIGSGPMDECVVTSVRNPQTVTRTIKDYYGPKNKYGKRKYRLITIVVHRSISVSLDCTSRT